MPVKGKIPDPIKLKRPAVTRCYQPIRVGSILRSNHQPTRLMLVTTYLRARRVVRLRSLGITCYGVLVPTPNAETFTAHITEAKHPGGRTTQTALATSSRGTSIESWGYHKVMLHFVDREHPQPGAEFIKIEEEN